MNLIPYSLSSDDDMVEQSPFSGVSEYCQSTSVAMLTRPGQAQGIYITLHPDAVDLAAGKFERWFAGRRDIRIVDVGTSDKAGLGFILMEWMECEIDQLFLAILNDEESVADYTLYGRNLEG